MNNDNNINNNETPVEDPYAILNIIPSNKSTTIKEIEKSYKLLSRSFHPDKVRVVSTNSSSGTSATTSESAQQYFVKLKSAYDILRDPVTKFALDYFGYEGVLFLKRQTKLYDQISTLLLAGSSSSTTGSTRSNGNDNNTTSTNTNDNDTNEYNNNNNHNKNIQKAIDIFREAMQYYNFQITSNKILHHKPNISGSMEINCNTTHSKLLLEGFEPLSSSSALDIDQTKLSLSISQPAGTTGGGSGTGTGTGTKNDGNKYGLTCTTSSSIKSTTGEGSTNTQLSVDYEPVQGTELTVSINNDINMTTKQNKDGSRRLNKQQPKLTIGSSRIMSNRTYVNANVSAPVKSILNVITTNRTSASASTSTSTSTIHSDDDEAKVKEEDDVDNDWMFSLTTHRSLFQDKIRCTWIAGIALPDCQLQYGMVSLSTNNNTNNILDDDSDDDSDIDDEDENEDEDNKHDNKNENKSKSQQKENKHHWLSKYPAKYTLKLNIGMSHTPIQIQSEKRLSKKQITTLSIGYGPVTGTNIKLLSKRTITKFCNLTLGIRHISSIGLYTLFSLERGSMNITVPILVSTMMSPAYMIKSCYVSMFMSLVDAMVGDIVDNENYLDITSSSNGGGSSSNTKDNGASSGTGTGNITNEEMLMEREKMKRDRLQQIQLMSNSAKQKMMIEQKKEDNLKDMSNGNGNGNRGGLVILNAKYEVTGGDRIDVTIALQFWVMNSSLHLPGDMSKSNMLGFYDVRRDSRGGGGGGGGMKYYEKGLLQAWWKVLVDGVDDVLSRTNSGRRHRMQQELEQQQQQQHESVPTLTVRYRHGGNVYEITVFDYEELSLPCRSAMKLGGSHVF